MENNIIQIDTPTGNENQFSRIYTYSCTLCSSQIEILSLNQIDSNIKITFKCLNNDISNNHGIKSMFLNEYLREMEKNIYISFQCHICQKKQNSNIDNKIYNFCINCREIICDNCLYLHQNNKKKHTLIKTNEINVKCLIHNCEIKSHCFDCKKQLCKLCLKERIHLLHKKSIIDEVQVSEEEKNIYNTIINILKDKEKTLENEHINNINSLKKGLEKEINNIIEKYNLKIANNNEELEANLEKEKNREKRKGRKGNNYRRYRTKT